MLLVALRGRIEPRYDDLPLSNDHTWYSDTAKQERMIIPPACLVMLPKTKGSPLGDIEFLSCSDHCVIALSSLPRRPQSRTDLLEMTGASTSTIGPTLREFETWRWIKTDGNEFEATQLGVFIASGVRELFERMETEQRLQGSGSGFRLRRVTSRLPCVLRRS